MYLAHLLPDIVPELARGVSTALAIWATPGCPPCPSLSCAPSLACPESHSCPACICQGSERACPASVDAPGALVFLVGFLSGIIIAILFSQGGLNKILSILRCLGYFVVSHLFARKQDSVIAPIRISAAQIALARRQQALETF